MNIVIALLILCGVIFFHELGHFLAAKACGIHVLEFALGMGPKILSFERGGTVYAWRVFPIGGMCVMQGEDEDDHSEGSFQNAKVWKRMIVVAAGPVFNFILAFAISLVVIFSIGADPATVSGVEAGSPAQAAGLEEGDLIVGYEGHGIANARELYMYIQFDGVPEDEISITYERDGRRNSASYVPEIDVRYLMGFNYDPEGAQAEISTVMDGYPMAQSGLEAGDIITAVNGFKVTTAASLIGYLDEHPLDGSPIDVTFLHDGLEYTVRVTPKISRSADGGFSFNMAREKQGFFTSIAYGFGEIKYWINSTIKSIASLFTGRFGIRDLSGPVGVVSTIGEVYNEASAEGLLTLVMTMLNMVILISANLGVINLLPLPALDGGRLVFLIIECIRRKPCSQKIEGAVHFAGIIALLALAAYVAFNDVLKLL